MINIVKNISFKIVPLHIFFFVFWFKNGFIDKVCGILLGIITPNTAYQGDTWTGWASYIVGTWDKSQVAHVLLSPTFSVLFPILILLQCLPFLLTIMSIVKGEFVVNVKRPWLMHAATSSMFVTGCMLFSQVLAGASDGQYLWQLLELGMVSIIYIKLQDNN
ncbi:hypothetical protein [Aeromonas finlandensis]|uniref:hypothetical protein n=1 Tax=Aeromonas finlandensis TaxID=1543375 RepID=UPI00051B19F7|nr:hypothetical protein [Aeromonas finlandensis]